MTEPPETRRRPLVWIAALAAAIVAGGLAWALTRPGEPSAYAAPGLDQPVAARELSANGFLVVPSLLEQVYLAFGETGEEAIYDGLAAVASGAALEALYLERIGAMAEAGLEPDQTIHEMELLGLSSRPEGGRVAMEARWRVLGTVGHAEHLHVRGNAYSADLLLEPVDGAWRLTGFALRDVDRTEAGTTTARVDGPWNRHEGGAGVSN